MSFNPDKITDTPIKNAGNTKLTYLAVNIGIDNLCGSEIKYIAANGIQNHRKIY